MPRYGLMVSEVEAKTKTKGNAMINPIPKNGLFTTLNANQVAGIIAGLPEHYRFTAYQIYFGTINMCQELIAAQIETLNHRDAKEYPVVTD